MKKPVKVTLITLAVLAVAGAGIGFGGKALVRRAREQVANSVDRYTVTRGDLSLTAVGSGKIVSADAETVIPQGSVKEIKVKAGDYVKKGDVLATVVGTTGQDENFTSDYEGVVTAVPGTAAASTSSGTKSLLTGGTSSSGFEISDENDLQMDIQATENDVYKIRTGQEASVYVDALSLTVSGTVTRVSLSGDTSGDYTTYDVTVKFKKGSNDIFLGMTGSATITVETKKNVLKVPTDALIEKNGKRYLLGAGWLQNLSRPQSDYYIEVKTGLADADTAEITGGDVEGKQILILPAATSNTLTFGRKTGSGSAK